MKLIGRRNFISGLGLGGSATVLLPLCRRLIRQAQGAVVDDRRVIFVTTNQGWSTEADDRMVTGPGYKAGANSIMFKSNVRSEKDWDLPVMFEPLKAHHKNMTVLFGFKNFMNSGGAPHGSGLSTLTGTQVLNPDEDGSPPSSISIDRFLGKELKQRHGDLVDSTNMATLMYGQYQTSTSADGRGKAADAYATPVKAYAAYFGSANNLTPRQVESTLALDQSLWDGLTGDIERVRMKMAGFERQKFDQALESARALETKLAARAKMTTSQEKPVAPKHNEGTLTNATVQGFIDVSVQAHTFGLTHVSHVAMHGYNTESDSRRALIPDIREDDTHNRVFHGDQGNYANIEEREADVRKINVWQSKQVARILDQLAAAPGSAGTLADDTLIVWINAGGYMHHRGHFNHPVVMIGNLHGKVRAPLWMDLTQYVSGQLYRLEGKRHICDAFVTIANALNVPITTFGDATVCKGAVPNVLA